MEARIAVKPILLSGLQDISKNMEACQEGWKQSSKLALGGGKDFHTGEASFLRLGRRAGVWFSRGWENFKPIKW